MNARKKKGLSQVELASLMNCKKTTISNWENGYSTPTLKDAFKLAYFLEEDINVLFLNFKVQETQTDDELINNNNPSFVSN